VGAPLIVIGAGGTAGHVVPALAVADALRDEGARVVFVGGERAERDLVPAAGYELRTMRVQPLARRDPVAAARLGAARSAIIAIAEASKLPVENLLSPDVLRRLSWDPPEPSDPMTVRAALASYGARAWQVELTAGPVAEAFNAGKSKPPDPGDTEHGDAG